MSVILENQSSSFLKNMELNVLDSLNAKMARPEGSSVHDGVPVPFQLPPGELPHPSVLGRLGHTPWVPLLLSWRRGLSGIALPSGQGLD